MFKILNGGESHMRLCSDKCCSWSSTLTSVLNPKLANVGHFSVIPSLPRVIILW